MQQIDALDYWARKRWDKYYLQRQQSLCYQIHSAQTIQSSVYHALFCLVSSKANWPINLDQGVRPESFHFSFDFDFDQIISANFLGHSVAQTF